MAHHVIRVTLLNDTTVDVLQSQNPLHANRNDTVEWVFANSNKEPVNAALVDCRGFMPLDRTAAIFGPPANPFGQQTNPLPKNQTFTVDANNPLGLYLYAIILSGQVLDWAVPLFRAGSFSSFFGGIIIKDPPGGG